MSNSRSVDQNLAEYILYLWQMEDLIRAFHFDMSAIFTHYVKPSFREELEARKEMNRIQVIAGEMMEEDVRDKGHIERTMRYMAELETLHQLMVSKTREAAYLKILETAKPHLDIFKVHKAKNRKMPDTEAALHVMYGILLLRLQKQPISPDTQEAADVIRRMLAFLSAAYNRLKDQ